MHRLAKLSEDERRRIIHDFLAWIELAELVSDDDFRRRIRGMAEHASHERDGSVERPDPESFRHTATLVAERGSTALAAGINPPSEEARLVIDEIALAFAKASGEENSPAFRTALAERFASGSDPRAERYWQLLAVINGWPRVPTTVPAWEWTVAGLRA